MYDKQEWRNDDKLTPLSAERLTHVEDGVESASQAADSAQAAADDVKSQLDAATYSATGNSLMKRTSKGAVSVATPTAGAHAANKQYVDDAIATAIAEALKPDPEVEP